MATKGQDDRVDGSREVRPPKAASVSTIEEALGPQLMYAHAMGKPVIFFSHSSRDAGPLSRVKARFVELTGSTIDVFLSSDGQSIRLGSNWLASIEQALSDSVLMFVFLSPNSVNSHWIYFESGHAYAKGVDVVPVGLFGIDVGTIPPPISMLQGFNVKGHESLNNIIAKTNEKFSYSHGLGFVPEDYALLRDSGPAEASRILGSHAEAIDCLYLSAQNVVLDENSFLQELETLAVDKVIGGWVCSIPGAQISLSKSEAKPAKYHLHASVDPSLVHVALPIVEALFRKATAQGTPAGLLPYKLVVALEFWVRMLSHNHLVMARLYGSKAVLARDANSMDEVRYTHGDLRFRPEQFASGPVISMECAGASFEKADLGSVIDLLFNCGILTYERRL